METSGSMFNDKGEGIRVSGFCSLKNPQRGGPINKTAKHLISVNGLFLELLLINSKGSHAQNKIFE